MVGDVNTSLYKSDVITSVTLPLPNYKPWFSTRAIIAGTVKFDNQAPYLYTLEYSEDLRLEPFGLRLFAAFCISQNSNMYDCYSL